MIDANNARGMNGIIKEEIKAKFDKWIKSKERRIEKILLKAIFKNEYYTTFPFIANKRMEKKGWTEWSSSWGHPYGAIFSFIAAFFFSIGIFVNIFNLIKVLVAPRVYLIEQLIILTKGGAR